MWLSRGGFRGGGAHPVRAPLKLEKIWFFWRKIVIFHTKYPKNFRASLRNWKKYDFLVSNRDFSHEIPQKCSRLPPLGAIFLSAPPLTWNPGSAPAVMRSLVVLVNKRADWNVPVSYIKYMSPCSACGFGTKKNIKSKHNFESGYFQTFCYFI
jgi:hypothetical protein